MTCLVSILNSIKCFFGYHEWIPVSDNPEKVSLGFKAYWVRLHACPHCGRIYAARQESAGSINAASQIREDE